MDLKLPGHAQCRDQGLPGVRRQGEERRRSGRAEAPGRQEGRARRRLRGRGRRRHLVAREDARSTRCRSNGTTARTRTASSASVRRGAEGRARRARMRSSATRSATRARRIAAAPRKIEAVYSYPHQNHATMEPMNATARWTPERCEVWTPTQNGEAALAAASEAAGLPLAKCDVYKLLLGGGFGRRGAVHDWVRQAVADREGDARHAGQAHLVARGGHDARPLPPGHAVQADRRPRRARAT